MTKAGFASSDAFNRSPAPCHTVCFQAVDYIHARDVVHVDIKPANILVTEKGVFKLGDFGLAVDLVHVSGG